MGERHRANAVSLLEGNVFLALGNRPIGQIELPELLEVFRRIEARGAHEMAHRIRALCEQIFRGVACGVCARDPAADLRRALAPVISSQMPTIPLEELPDLLRGGSTHARKRLLAGIAKPGSRLS